MLLSGREDRFRLALVTLADIDERGVARACIELILLQHLRVGLIDRLDDLLKRALQISVMLQEVE